MNCEINKCHTDVFLFSALLLLVGCRGGHLTRVLSTYFQRFFSTTNGRGKPMWNQLTQVHLENGGGCVGSGRIDFSRLRCLVLALVCVMTFYLTLMFGRRCRSHCIDWAWRWYWDFTRAVWPISSYLWRGASLVLLSWYWYLVASWKIVQQWWLQSLLCRKWCPA